MRVVVFGGTGPTGRLVVQQALAEGLRVRVLARSPEKLAERPEGLEVVQGDALRADDVSAAVEGQDAVVCTLGVPYTFRPVRLYSEATTHLLAAMGQHGVRRLVAVTSGGTYPGRDPINPWFFEWVLKPTIGRTLYADMRRMEDMITASDLDWTVLRPSRLLDTEASGAVRVQAGVHALPGGDTVSRADLASVIVAQLVDPTLVRQAAAVAT